MAGTIQRIAELAGVSRGTVDRAINGRGRVNEETAAGSVRLRMNWDMFQNTEKKSGGRTDRYARTGQNNWCDYAAVPFLLYDRSEPGNFGSQCKA